MCDKDLALRRSWPGTVAIWIHFWKSVLQIVRRSLFCISKMTSTKVYLESFLSVANLSLVFFCVPQTGPCHVKITGLPRLVSKKVFCTGALLRQYFSSRCSPIPTETPPPPMLPLSPYRLLSCGVIWHHPFFYVIMEWAISCIRSYAGMLTPFCLLDVQNLRSPISVFLKMPPSLVYGVCLSRSLQKPHTAPEAPTICHFVAKSAANT